MGVNGQGSQLCLRNTSIRNTLLYPCYRGVSSAMVDSETFLFPWVRVVCLSVWWGNSGERGLSSLIIGSIYCSLFCSSLFSTFLSRLACYMPLPTDRPRWKEGLLPGAAAGKATLLYVLCAFLPCASARCIHRMQHITSQTHAQWQLPQLERGFPASSWYAKL